MGANREIVHNIGKMLVSRDILKSMAIEFSKNSKGSFRKQLETVSVPKLFEVVSLAMASLMSVLDHNGSESKVWSRALYLIFN